MYGHDNTVLMQDTVLWVSRSQQVVGQLHIHNLYGRTSTDSSVLFVRISSDRIYYDLSHYSHRSMRRKRTGIAGQKKRRRRDNYQDKKIQPIHQTQRSRHLRSVELIEQSSY